MQIDNSQLLIWFFCILCSILQAIITIFHQKIRNRIQFKLYSVIFFGNVIFLLILSNFLVIFSQDLIVIIFEMFEIIFLQICLLIYVKIIWRKETTLPLFFFSIFLFLTFRTIGLYFLAQLISLDLPSSFSYIFYIYNEVLIITCVLLFLSFLLFVFIRIFSNISIYRSIFTLIWACMFVFGLSPFIDLLYCNLTVYKPFYLFYTWPFIGDTVGLISFGTFIQFRILAIIIILLGMVLGIKHGFKFLSPIKTSNENWLKRYLGIEFIIIILIEIGYVFIFLILFNYQITVEIAEMLGYTSFTQPYWLLSNIYLILLLIPFYCAYLIFIIIKNRKKLWDQPNSFNKTPFLNLIVIPISGFIVGYAELMEPEVGAYLARSFILLVIFFYLILFLALLSIYILTFQKKPWINLSYSLKIMVTFIPFIIGYFLAGQILSVSELLFGLMACAALQAFALYLRIVRTNSVNLDEKRLNSVILIFWGILATSLAGLLSIISLICIIICIILLVIIEFYCIERDGAKLIIYGLIIGIILVMGGISQTFLITPFAVGVPNTVVLSVFSFSIIAIGVIYYIRK